MTYAIRNVTVADGKAIHLDGLNLELPASGVVTVIGRTLAGKTTFLKVLAGLQEVRSGSLVRDGADLLKVPAWKRRVGMVYQQFVNYPHLNVRDNITFPLKRAGSSASELEAKLSYVSELLGLQPYLERRPAALSGGQQQRVALARALVKDTDFLLLDEPLVNLDYKLREQLRDEFRRIFRDSKDRLVVYATTEPAEAMILQGHVIILHEGKVVQTGDYRDVYHYPANTSAASIFNDPPMNLLQGEIANGQVVIGPSFSTALPAHMGSLSPGGYVFGLRAVDMAIGGNFSATVALAEVNGSVTVLHLDLDGRNLVLEEEGVHVHRTGDRIGFSADCDRLYAFDAVSGRLIAAPRRKSVSGQRD